MTTQQNAATGAAEAAQQAVQQATDAAAARGETLDRADITAIVNAAITNHGKRQAPQIEKLVADAVAKALASAQVAQSAQQGGQGEQGGQQSGAQAQTARPDPTTVKLREELDALKKKYEEADSRAKQTEQRARQEAARGALRQQLEAKGVKGARASALISHFEVSGALRFDDDGRPQLAVSRARAKGAQPEEVAFDLAGGVDDWAKSPDAADFLPPPTTPALLRPGARAPGLLTPKLAATATSGAPTSLEEDVALALQDVQQLTRPR